MNHNAVFGSIIRKHREQLNMSQDALAECAGVHRTYIYQIEKGLKSPTLNTIFALCGALNIGFAFLAQSVEDSIYDSERGQNN